MVIAATAAASATVHKLTRVCPKCGKKQVIPKSKENRTVSCKYCGADVPVCKRRR